MTAHLRVHFKAQGSMASKYLLGKHFLGGAIAIALALGPSKVQAQFTSQPSLELGCQHLYPIMLKYNEKHVTFSEPTKNLESRTIEQFIKRLDPSKIYLMESDVTTIQKTMAGVFDKVKKKDCAPITQSHKLYKDRLEARVAYARKTLVKNFKFNPKVEIVLDPDLRKRPKNKSEVNQFHDKYLQYQLSTYLATEENPEEAKAQVVRSYERFQRRIQEMKITDVWSLYLDAYARALDPHSSYLSKDALEDFEISMRLSLEGIGATLSSKDGFTVIEQLIPGGAAFRSGKLKNKDKIVAVAQGDGAFENVIEMDLREVVRLIRGPKSTVVRVKVLRKSDKETTSFEVALARDKIKLEDDAASISYLDREIGGKKKKVGLINLPSFYADNRLDGTSATKDLKKLLVEANKNKVDSLVLDLSSNGGGALKDAVDIAGLFFGKGNVVKQSQRMASDEEKMQYEVLRDTDSTVNYTGPLVVLINRVAASASEIVSGTLKDYKRAVVVGGDHTFGKGSVQSVEYLPPGLGAVKTTVGMFFIPGGNSTQHKGVDADIVFPSAYSTDEIGEKTLDYSLPPKKISPFLSATAYVSSGDGAWKTLEKVQIDSLKEKSAKRIAQSKDFKKIVDDIAKHKKKGKTLVVGDLVKGKSKDGKVKETTAAAAEEEEDPEESSRYLSREERMKKYLERADIQEAVTIAAELEVELSGPPITIGQKEKDKDPKVFGPGTSSGTN